MFNLVNLIMLKAPVLFSSASTSTSDFNKISDPIVQLIDSLFKPAMAIVVAVGSLYCIMLGVKYAKAEEPQEHEKAKNHLKNAIIGFVLIFILMLALKIGNQIMGNWYDANKSTSAIISSLL